MVKTTIWHLICEDAFQRGDVPQKERDQLGVLQLRHDLWQWYEAEKVRNPARHLHRLGDLTLSMIGKQSAPCLSTKAAETKTLIFFLVSELEKYRGQIESHKTRALITVGKSMISLFDTLDSSKRKMTARQIQTAYDCIKKMNALWDTADIHRTPKLHLTFHMIERAQTEGNPNFYSTYLDESLNRTLRDIARVAHRRVWEMRMFDSFARSEQRRSVRQRQ